MIFKPFLEVRYTNRFGSGNAIVTLAWYAYEEIDPSYSSGRCFRDLMQRLQIVTEFHAIICNSITENFMSHEKLYSGVDMQ